MTSSPPSWSFKISAEFWESSANRCICLSYRNSQNISSVVFFRIKFPRKFETFWINKKKRIIHSQWKMKWWRSPKKNFVYTESKAIIIKTQEALINVFFPLIFHLDRLESFVFKNCIFSHIHCQCWVAKILAIKNTHEKRNRSNYHYAYWWK